MANCERMQAHLNDFLDGTLGATQAQELNAHLEACEICRDEYLALKSTQEAVRAVAVPDGRMAKQRVLAQFRVAVEAHRRLPEAPVSLNRMRIASLGLVVAAAASLFFLVRSPANEQAIIPTSDVKSDLTKIVTASSGQFLPSASDLDQMISVHAVQSLSVENGSNELQRDDLADANSRLNQQINSQGGSAP